MSSLRRCRFHLSCVGLTKKALDNIDEYSCAACTEKTGKGTTCEYSVARGHHPDVASATSLGIMYDWARIAAVVLVENVIRHLSDSTRESLGLLLLLLFLDSRLSRRVVRHLLPAISVRRWHMLVHPRHAARTSCSWHVVAGMGLRAPPPPTCPRFPSRHHALAP